MRTEDIMNQVKKEILLESGVGENPNKTDGSIAGKIQKNNKFINFNEKTG